ncbi:Uncharacterized protein APZ42_002467, partial [Daphnia magna]
TAVFHPSQKSNSSISIIQPSLLPNLSQLSFIDFNFFSRTWKFWSLDPVLTISSPFSVADQHA